MILKIKQFIIAIKITLLIYFCMVKYNCFLSVSNATRHFLTNYDEIKLSMTII